MAQTLLGMAREPLLIVLKPYFGSLLFTRSFHAFFNEDARSRVCYLDIGSLELRARGWFYDRRFSLYMHFTLAVKRHKYKRMLNNGLGARVCVVKMFPLRAARSRRRKVKNCEYVFGFVLLCNFASYRFSICPSSEVNVTSRASKRLAYLPSSLAPTMSVK